MKYRKSISETRFSRAFAGGIAVTLLLASVATLTAASSEDPLRWRVAYSLSGFALLLVVFFPVARVLQRRGIW